MPGENAGAHRVSAFEARSKRGCDVGTRRRDSPMRMGQAPPSVRRLRVAGSLRRGRLGLCVVEGIPASASSVCRLNRSASLMYGARTTISPGGTCACSTSVPNLSCNPLDHLRIEAEAHLRHDEGRPRSDSISASFAGGAVRPSRLSARAFGLATVDVASAQDGACCPFKTPALAVTW